LIYQKDQKAAEKSDEGELLSSHGIAWTWGGPEPKACVILYYHWRK
jgi:hypothetical protein